MIIRGERGDYPFEYIMRKIHLAKKFDFHVPDTVISALWNIYKKSQILELENSNISNKHGNCINVIELQTNKNLPTDHMKIEFYKLRNQWKFVDDDILLVDAFLKQHFSSAFMFRIDTMMANSLLTWHSMHLYPRVFISMHENKCNFFIKNKELQNLTLQFSPGTCWMWDVREQHMVDNTEANEDRVMACFSIDPAVETIADIFI